MIIFKIDDIPKHKKKKNKKNKKSNHKHKYKKCLFHQKGKLEYFSGEYCEVCGKIKEIKFFESFKNERGFYQCYTNEELLDKYEDLEIKEIEDIYTSTYILNTRNT